MSALRDLLSTALAGRASPAIEHWHKMDPRDRESLLRELRGGHPDSPRSIAREALIELAAIEAAGAVR